MARLTCPYCFTLVERAAPWAYRCTNPDATRCALEDDKVLMKYERASTPRKLNRVFEVAPNATAVCRCGETTTKRVCPHCHCELPGQFGDSESFTFALVGTKESGKSNYIAVLVNELANRVGRKFNASLSALDEQTISRYSNDFRSHVFLKREVVPTTRSGRADAKTRMPLIYRFSMQQKAFGLFERLRVSSLVFFDTAGEDLTHLDLASTEARYITNCDGLIFLLDPLQMPGVRQQVLPGAPPPPHDNSPTEVMGRVTELLRRNGGLSAEKKLNVPVAIAFSKIDAVLPRFSPVSPLRNASSHPGYFDRDDAERVSADIRAHVTQWDGDALDRLMLHNYRRYSYFGVSALGAPPTSDGRLTQAVAPFRVEDPFLWLLHQVGLVKAGTRGRS